MKSALPELELVDLGALDSGGGVDVGLERDVRGWWPVVAAAGVAVALLLSGRSTSHVDAQAPLAVPPVPTTAATSAVPGQSFSIVMSDSLSKRIVMVDPHGRAVRLDIPAGDPIRALDLAPPKPMDSSLGGLPEGRRPVAVLDKSIDRLRELDQIFAGTVQTGYASVLEVESRLAEADLVIGAVLVKGAKAPHVVTREQLKLMKRRSVLVDVAIDQGGCFETSHPTTHTDPVKVEFALMKLVPKRQWTSFSHRMIFHGRQVCHARKPDCASCTLAKVCGKVGV